MKRHISVFSLFARWSLFKVLGVLVLMCVGEIGWFLWKLQWAASPERAFDDAGLQYFFGAAAVLVTVLLLKVASGETTGYTLNRLQISRRSVFFWHCLYNGCMYLLLWLMQAVLAAGLCGYFLTQWQDAGSQSFVLAIYRQDFLHSLLPMAEGILWVRNLLLSAALGVGAAYFSLRRRRGMVSYLVLLPIIGVAMFVNGLGFSGGEFVSICLSAATIICVVYEAHANEELIP